MVEDGNFSLIGKLIIMLINCMPHNINSVSNTTHLLAHSSPATIMTNPIITSLSKQAPRNRQKTETAEGGGRNFHDDRRTLNPIDKPTTSERHFEHKIELKVK